MSIKNPILIDLPMPIRTERLLIRPIMPGDGSKMHEAVMESIGQLKKWLIWAHEEQSLEYAEIITRQFYADFILRKAVHMMILVGDELIGMCAFNKFDWNIPSTSVGYWCRSSQQGKGYISEAITAITVYAFKQIGVKRLTILCDDENQQSSAIPERLNFQLEVRAKGLIDKPNCEDLCIGRTYVRFDTEGLDAVNVIW